MTHKKTCDQTTVSAFTRLNLQGCIIFYSILFASQSLVLNLSFMLELTYTVIVSIILIAFVTEYIDATLGMGYGTTITPILLLMGFEPLQVVPTILLSEFITGLLAGFVHHKVGNVDFRPTIMNPKLIYKEIQKFGFKETFDRIAPLHLKITLLFGISSILGTIFAVFIAVRIPKIYLQLYIGLLVAGIGIMILLTLHKQFRFSWSKISILSMIASFNKGMSGGGYGPIITGGQLLAGIDGKNAVGITSVAEGLTCLVGVIAYLTTHNKIDWTLAPYLALGAVLSVPISALTVKKIQTGNLRILIGILTLTLGVITLYKIFF